MHRYGQKTSKIPPNWVFSPICDPPRFFFKNRALSLLYPYGALTTCKKLEKINGRSLRYSKTDGKTHGRTTDGQKWLHRTPSDKPGSKMVVKNKYRTVWVGDVSNKYPLVINANSQTVNASGSLNILIVSLITYHACGYALCVKGKKSISV